MLLNCGVGKDSFESPLDGKEIKPVHPKGDQSEIKPVHPKGDQSWVFTGRTDDEAETPTLWPPDVNS